MIKKLTVVMAVVLAVCVVAAVILTFKLGAGKPEQPEQTQAVTEETATVGEEQPTEKESETEPEKETTKKKTEKSTVKEEISKLDITYESTTKFEVKLQTRTFKGQDDRFKMYKQIYDESFGEKETAVFFYDITHDGLADMIVISHIYNEETKKSVGRILQLFTITGEENNTVTEIFRDYGGVRTTGNGISFYVTEQEEGDCLLIVKEELDDSIGKLSYKVIYVLDDATVVTKSSGQYTTDEGMDYEHEAAFDRYNIKVEEQIDLAHTTLFNYLHPKAVKSPAKDAFAKYLD